MMRKFGPAAEDMREIIMLINAPFTQHMVISFLERITTQLKEKNV